MVKHFILTFFFFINTADCMNPKAVDLHHQAITLGLTAEPTSLNSAVASELVSQLILNHITEGLMTYNDKLELVGGVAYKWHSTRDKVHFWLRPDTKWSDGSIVVAKDFISAWQYALNPKTASPYAFILYPIKNAEAINQGTKPLTTLGVEAPNEFELIIHLEKPCPYFLSLTAFKTYRPIKSSWLEKWGINYAQDTESILSNGPFMLSKWTPQKRITLTKNPHYWQKEKIQLNKIDIPYITNESRTLFNAFQDNQIATWFEPALDHNEIKLALKKQIPLKHFTSGKIHFMAFNHRANRITANQSLRIAIQTIINAEEYSLKVRGQRAKPMYGLFPSWLDKQFKTKLYLDKKPNVHHKKALEYLEQAKKELNLKQLPSLSLLLVDSPTANIQAEYFQQLFKEKLGLTIKIDKQILKHQHAKCLSGDFDLLLTLWSPDFNDPMTYAEIFASWNPNNYGHFHSKIYDQMLLNSQTIENFATRGIVFAKMQEYLNKEAVFMPLYENNIVYIMHPMLKNAFLNPIGDAFNFNYSYLQP